MEKHDLKCTITITGKTGEEEAKMTVEFDPEIKGDAKEWTSGAGEMVKQVMDVLSGSIA